MLGPPMLAPPRGRRPARLRLESLRRMPAATPSACRGHSLLFFVRPLPATCTATYLPTYLPTATPSAWVPAAHPCGHAFGVSGAQSAFFVRPLPATCTATYLQPRLRRGRVPAQTWLILPVVQAAPLGGKVNYFTFWAGPGVTLGGPGGGGCGGKINYFTFGAGPVVKLRELGELQGYSLLSLSLSSSLSYSIIDCMFR